MDKEVFMKNKKKIIIVVAAIAVSLIGFSLLNSTYSLFYHEEISKNTEGYSTGTLSITASSKGSTISLSDALPVEDSVGSTSTPYTFTITNTGNLNYKFNIKLLSTGSSSTTIGSQYIKLKVDNGSVTTLSSLSNGIIKKDVTLKAGASIDISVRVWLSISTPNSQIGKTFNSKIVIDGQAVYTEDSSLPDIYQKVEYIESTGTQYIKTNNTCNYNETVTMVTTGSFDSSNSEAWHGVNAYLQQRFSSNTVSDGNSTLTITSPDTITASYNGTSHVQTITVASSGKSISRTWSDSSYGGKIMIFKLGQGNDAYSTSAVSGKINSVKVYNSGVLAAYLIPCYRKSDSVIGMYDVVSKVFYINDGTGTFNKGADVTG